MRDAFLPRTLCTRTRGKLMLTSYPLTVAGDSLSLWQEYRQTRDRALRDRLILTYAPLVKFVAGRLGATLPSHVDEQDLVSYGLLGLIGAIERFDPSREIKFETFAMARIRGESEEHTSELQSQFHLVCRLLLEKKKQQKPSEMSSK